MATTSSLVSESMFINGENVITSKKIEIYNPAKISEKIGEITAGDEGHVNNAVAAAEQAWLEWSNTPPKERVKIFEQTIQYIQDHVEDLSRILTLETGRPLKETKGDLFAGIGVLRYYSTLHEELKDREIVNHQGKLILTRHPVGVVSIIVPWNSPVVLAFLMLAPSLLAGNCIVIKPATYAPLGVTQILKAMAQSLPKGVLNIVLGSGSTVGNVMVEHSKVRKVSFTGSTDTGRSIMQKAANNLKKLSMELGGNDAALVLEDVPVNDHLIEELKSAVFTGAGQICYSVKRIYVPRKVYSDFVTKFTAAASKIKVGPGVNPETDMGPVNNKSQFDSVTALIEKAKANGSKVTTVGELIEGVSQEDGYFILPTIITDVKQNDEIVQCEQFGPVIPIIAYDTEEEAVAYVNDSEFGLANSVWTTDEEYGFKLARKLQSGSVFVNTHRLGASAANMPFGGFKQSGIGRGHGVEALHEHTELQSIIKRIDM